MQRSGKIGAIAKRIRSFWKLILGFLDVGISKLELSSSEHKVHVYNSCLNKWP